MVLGIEVLQIACSVVEYDVLGASRSEVSRPALHIENVAFERVNILSAKNAMFVSEPLNPYLGM